jgi:hypothetical protein
MNSDTRLPPKEPASPGEACPQCGHHTLSLLPGARRKSCSLCHYQLDEAEDDDLPQSFQSVPSVYSRFKGTPRVYKTRTSAVPVNLSSVLLGLLMLVGAWFFWQAFYQEPEDLKGLRAMEQSYTKICHLVTHQREASGAERLKMRRLILREKAAITHLPVSECLITARNSLFNLYALFDKGLQKSSFDFQKSRRILNVSARFVSEASQCQETFAPEQASGLRLFTDFAKPR